MSGRVVVAARRPAWWKVVPTAVALVGATTTCGLTPDRHRPEDAGASTTSTTSTTPGDRFRVLVFTRTTGFRHASIADGIAAVREIGAEAAFDVDATEDPAVFSNAQLRRYAAVVFLSTTGDVLDTNGQGAFERYVRAGGGFVGVHSATDTEYRWPYYGRLVGAYFSRHPAVQRARLKVEDPTHVSTRSLPDPWERSDEWYDFRANPRPRVHVLLTIEETSYTGGGMGTDHPIAWCHAVDGGRAWYTALGHTQETYSERSFRDHLRGGIEYAAGRAGGCGR